MLLSSSSQYSTMNKRTVSLSGPPLKKSSSPFRWTTRQKSDSRPPKKPLSSYNIYFLLERERIVSGDNNNNNNLRIYTIEDVQNIVKLQKWNHNHRKRQHRKTHGKISFHDLSRVVAENWRKLDEQYKDVFNQQAAIEKAIYKKEMDQWIIKQMNHNHYNNNTTDNTNSVKVDKQHIDNAKVGSHTNKMNDVNTIDIDDEVNSKQLSNQDVFHLLEYFDITENDDTIEEKVVSNNMHQIVTTSENHMNITNHNYIHHETNMTDDDDLYNWKIDIDGPLWYNNAKNCSEEFALQMIEAMNNNNSFSSYYDRAITL